MPMSALLEEVARDHFPSAPASALELEEFERRMGWTLDPDLRAFYLHCNGAELLHRRPDCPYRILPLPEIARARIAIYGKDEDRLGPASQYALCDVQDGNYVLLDVSRRENGRYPLVDGWREAWPDPKHCGPVASSFADFLENVLRTRENLYWLEP